MRVSPRRSGLSGLLTCTPVEMDLFRADDLGRRLAVCGHTLGPSPAERANCVP
jgi:hypothetical protein